ncbi:Endoplasmic reticulum oxidoreductins 1 isoform 1 [Hibiscus syriacus]|uniref:Endoplasmic reticulum oxidoreductins 1 isoform 1 n=1 Tax=Hibiscus syriacus TaxID=106335 RepID=A0A6A3AWD3_HIBSY|nr:Endoplasmic reticulum oxidoreductins 1 isoform 1 [Hibiscus syriacus]
MSQEHEPPSASPPARLLPPFDPSRIIGIIKRKALIKELAAVYHTKCLAKCQELMELQKKWDEPYIYVKTPDDSRKEKRRPPKRLKKSR